MTEDFYDRRLSEGEGRGQKHAHSEHGMSTQTPTTLTDEANGRTVIDHGPPGPGRGPGVPHRQPWGWTWRAAWSIPAPSRSQRVSQERARTVTAA